jgi:hypothetical protein
MLKFGLQLEPLISIFRCLQKAEHKIHTTYGNSTYGGTRQVPLQGCPHGNGCGPASYVAISAIIISMMKSSGFGAKFLTAMSLLMIHFLCIFVDDSDTVNTGTTSDRPGEEVATTMQEVVDHWEEGLQATGGAIVAEKSSWYLIDFEWEGNSWHYRK